MPGVKWLHQESNNSGKPAFIYGHHFGVLGLLAGSTQKVFCVPLSAWLQEGIGKLVGSDHNGQKLNLSTVMSSRAIQMVTTLHNRSLVVLDAFYAVGPCFLSFKDHCSQTGHEMIHLVMRAKSNTVGHEPEIHKGRGRPRKYGKIVRLTDLFTTGRNNLQSLMITIYGQQTELKFCCLDLIWKPVKDKLRFVLVIFQDKPFILMCSDLSLAPVDMIAAYSYRFKIEGCFNALKNVIGAFFE
jgi:hypothetical protein